MERGIEEKYGARDREQGKVGRKSGERGEKVIAKCQLYHLNKIISPFSCGITTW